MFHSCFFNVFLFDRGLAFIHTLLCFSILMVVFYYIYIYSSLTAKDKRINDLVEEGLSVCL